MPIFQDDPSVRLLLMPEESIVLSQVGAVLAWGAFQTVQCSQHAHARPFDTSPILPPLAVFCQT